MRFGLSLAAALALSASPLLAPSIGSLMITSMGWRHLFAALGGLAILDLALVAVAFAPKDNASLQS